MRPEPGTGPRPEPSLDPTAFAEPYCDPPFDSPTDPVVVHDPATDEWVLFYTQRRATLGLPGSEWVHGSKIGVARSTDGGRTWTYRGTVADLDHNDVTADPQTHWAPDIARVDGLWLMFLTVVEGSYADWGGRAAIHEYVSDDLEHWQWLGQLRLDSDRVIDAAYARTADGRSRLWYKDETRGSTTYMAVTDTPFDASSWSVVGQAVGSPPHEGPKAFELGGWWWMIVDEWRGLGVYRSRDGVDGWQRQEEGGGLIAVSPERIEGHPVHARHADVVPLPYGHPSESAALLIYFTHPGFSDSRSSKMDTQAERRSHIRAAVLHVADDTLWCAAG